jgi:hypothetical protein
MPGVGLEPTRIAPADFKSAASANSATPALTEAILLLLLGGFNLTPLIPLSILGEGESIYKRGANAPLKHPLSQPHSKGENEKRGRGIKGDGVTI